MVKCPHCAIKDERRRDLAGIIKVRNAEITDLQAALAEKEKLYQDSFSSNNDRIARIYMKNKRIEKLEAKLKSAEAVVEAGRRGLVDTASRIRVWLSTWEASLQDRAIDMLREISIVADEAALSAHDKKKQEPEEKHFIEDGLTDA